jgi:hypothetical protein
VIVGAASTAATRRGPNLKCFGVWKFFLALSKFSTFGASASSKDESISDEWRPVIVLYCVLHASAELKSAAHTSCTIRGFSEKTRASTLRFSRSLLMSIDGSCQA